MFSPAKRRIQQRAHHEDSSHVHFDFRKDTRGKVHGMVLYPHDYVKVKSKEDLTNLLDHFGHHVVWWELLPKTTFARKAFVERVRPALRFYCEKYGEKVPGWLEEETDKKFVEMPPSKQRELFGVDQISVAKFKKVEPPPLLPERQAQHGQQPQKPSKPKPQPGAKS